MLLSLRILLHQTIHLANCEQNWTEGRVNFAAADGKIKFPNTIISPEV
jgi:hypothetical protein